jgi:hypothetical protein
VPLGTTYKMTMANTYTQIHIQAVFAVQNRQSLIAEEWKEGSAIPIHHWNNSAKRSEIALNKRYAGSHSSAFRIETHSVIIRLYETSQTGFIQMDEPQ